MEENKVLNFNQTLICPCHIPLVKRIEMDEVTRITKVAAYIVDSDF